MSAVAEVIEYEELPELAPPTAVPESNPIEAVIRAMRGRWRQVIAASVIVGSGLSFVGYSAGTQLYEAQAVLRVFPQESNILYSTGEASVLKIFDSFVKAETSYAASRPVMSRATDQLIASAPDLEGALLVTDLMRSIEIRRVDSLIVFKTKSRDADFAFEKLDAVIGAYFALKQEAASTRSQIRLSELHSRETSLVQRLKELREYQLEVGGQFGLATIIKAHAEKIAQIETLSAKFSEVSANLKALETGVDSVSVDTSDQDILYAVLLDRTMADLGFEKAKLESELAGLQTGYDGQINQRLGLKISAKREAISVIEQAISDRHEQIRLLGKIGALTDTADSSGETDTAEFQALYENIQAQLEAARNDAFDLNRKRIELEKIDQDIAETQELLKETRQALEVLRLETGRALPGYTVLMSPPEVPTEFSDDNRKLLAVLLFGFGAWLVLFAALIKALTERKLRFAETLSPISQLLSVVHVSSQAAGDANTADVIRNELQLKPLRKPRLVGTAAVISVTRSCSGETTDLAYSLAESFSRSQLRTLFIEADLECAIRTANKGWCCLLKGRQLEPVAVPDTPYLWGLPSNPASELVDADVSAPMVKNALELVVDEFDAVIISTGSFQERLASQFVLAASDVGLLQVVPTDQRKPIFKIADRLNELPRNGSVAAMFNALPKDPWLAINT